MKSTNLAEFIAATRRLLLKTMLVILVAWAAPAVALAGPDGCKLQGSWMGFGAVGGQWISSVHGQSTSSGTIALELPEFSPTLFGFFPDAVKITTLRGVWERVDGNTFSYTMIGMAMDAAGSTIWIGKNSGYDTISEDCTLLTVVSTLEAFFGGQDPFVDTPFFATPIPVHYAHRMHVDPPASF